MHLWVYSSIYKADSYHLSDTIVGLTEYFIMGQDLKNVPAVAVTNAQRKTYTWKRNTQGHNQWQFIVNELSDL